MTIWRRFTDVIQRRRLTAEMNEELRFHRDNIARERRAEGRSDADADDDARRRMGNTTLIAEEARSMWSVGWFEHLMQDLRYGWRALRRSPGFTAVATLTLALGIGANTAIFTVLNGVIFRPLPFKDPGRIVMLWETMPQLPQIMVSYPNFRDWRGRLRTFDDVAVYHGFGNGTLTGMGSAERVPLGLGSGNLFDMLGVHPTLGRVFSDRDDQVGAERVAVITDAFWQRKFARDSSVIGKPLMIDGFSYSIVGVLPPRVRLAQRDVWVPIGLFANTERFLDRMNHPGTIGLGRLKPGVSLPAMQADLDATYAQLRAAYPRENAGVGAGGEFFIDQVLGSIKPALYVIAGAVALVLLIACANVANLLLGRASSRSRELALRLALGARRSRIIRQLLTESVLLSAIGGALGVALAWGGVRVLLSLRPSNLPRIVDIQVDLTVLGFAFLLSVVTGIAFGVLPALQAVRGDLARSMHEGGRGGTAGVHRLKLRGALMVTEVALALVLLVSAGLLMRSFQFLTNVDIGADPRNVLAGAVTLPEPRYGDSTRQAAAFDALLERVRAIPNVTDASLSTDLPVTSSWQSGVTFDGQPPVTPGSEPLFNFVVAYHDWFKTMRMQLHAGRFFEATDVLNAPPVTVISEAVARRLGGPAKAIGMRMKQGTATATTPWVTIVGVVNDTKDDGPGRQSRGAVYLPFAQNPTNSLWLAVRTTGRAAAVAPALRDALAQIDPDVPLANLQTLDQQVAGWVAQPKFSMLMVSIFAAIALALAAIGIYGVISYNVAQRTHEIGIRMALGAHQADVIGMVARQVLVLTGVGIAIGMVMALGAKGALGQLLYGIQPTDPLTFGSMAIGLALVALAAAAIPAWRAARLDPVSTLRAD
jgi:putative ABC transport system permease protein